MQLRGERVHRWGLEGEDLLGLSWGSPSANAQEIQKQVLLFRGEIFLLEDGCCWGERTGFG